MSDKGRRGGKEWIVKRFIQCLGILLFAIPVVVITAIVVLSGRLLWSWLIR